MKNETVDEIQKTSGNLYCSLDGALVEDVKQFSMFLAAFDIILSLVAFLGNTLILDALRKESSIRPPFGPQKVEKYLKKAKKARKRLRLRSDVPYHHTRKKTSTLVKEKYANFIKSILSSSSKMLLSILLILDR